MLKKSKLEILFLYQDDNKIRYINIFLLIFKAFLMIFLDLH